VKNKTPCRLTTRGKQNRFPAAQMEDKKNDGQVVLIGGSQHGR